MQSFAGILARDIMHRDLISVRPEQSLADLRHLLIESHISGAPVVDEQGRLVGIISRSDLVRVEELVETLDDQVSGSEIWLDDQADGFKHPAPQGFHGFLKRLGQYRVKDAMRGQVLTCAPTTPAPELAAEMVRHHVHRIIVIEDERPIGIVSSLDMTALIAGTSPK
ncbi:MAG TPA: CBS domain-containing protein [Pirellulales bacterium]|jgi:CBS domain-containing protein|nr:CBS domain-containing protein [Pirellulales bacterium]